MRDASVLNQIFSRQSRDEAPILEFRKMWFLVAISPTSTIILLMYLLFLRPSLDILSNDPCFRTPFSQGSPNGVVVYVLNCDIIVSEFELQSRYYVYFRTNSLGKGMNLLTPPPSYK